MSIKSTAAGWPVGVDRILLEEVDSTNAEAARRATQTTTPTWILARCQTKGRGRRGRPWADPVGNFAASHLMFPDEPLKDVALNSFIASIALRLALMDVAPSEGYALKWPNDVLLNGKKIAGILLETSGTQDRVDWLVIGIGVNLKNAPDQTEFEPRANQPASIFTELGVCPHPDDLLASLAHHFEITRKLYRDAGFEAIRILWLGHAANLGGTVTARTMRDEITGTFEDIDNEGNLILKTPKGRVAVTAADIFF